jgi:hypothetical protein
MLSPASRACNKNLLRLLGFMLSPAARACNKNLLRLLGFMLLPASRARKVKDEHFINSGIATFV